MKLIKLTLLHDSPVYVNPDHVVAISQDDKFPNGTEIMCVNWSTPVFTVKDKIETVRRLLEGYGRDQIQE